jgi:hypothetical protein
MLQGPSPCPTRPERLLRWSTAPTQTNHFRQAAQRERLLSRVRWAAHASHAQSPGPARCPTAPLSRSRPGRLGAEDPWTARPAARQAGPRRRRRPSCTQAVEPSKTSETGRRGGARAHRCPYFSRKRPSVPPKAHRKGRQATPCSAAAAARVPARRSLLGTGPLPNLWNGPPESLEKRGTEIRPASKDVRSLSCAVGMRFRQRVTIMSALSHVRGFTLGAAIAVILLLFTLILPTGWSGAHARASAAPASWRERDGFSCGARSCAWASSWSVASLFRGQPLSATCKTRGRARSGAGNVAMVSDIAPNTARTLAALLAEARAGRRAPLPCLRAAPEGGGEGNGTPGGDEASVGAGGEPPEDGDGDGEGTDPAGEGYRGTLSLLARAAAARAGKMGWRDPAASSAPAPADAADAADRDAGTGDIGAQLYVSRRGTRSDPSEEVRPRPGAAPCREYAWTRHTACPISTG